MTNELLWVDELFKFLSAYPNWIFALIALVVIAEGIYLYSIRSSKRYKQNLIGHSVLTKCASLALSALMFLIVYVLLILVQMIFEQIVYIAFAALGMVAVAGYFWINYLIAKKYSKKITFKKGEKLVANQDFDGVHNLTKGEIVTYVGDDYYEYDCIKVRKKSGKVQSNKYHRFDKLK